MAKDLDEELIVNQNSSMLESSGFGFGLEGNLFIYLVGGLMASLFFLLILISVFNIPIIPAVIAGIIPAALMCLYLKVFRIGKPPAYQKDLIELWTGGDCVDAHPLQQKENPVRKKEIK